MDFNPNLSSDEETQNITLKRKRRRKHQPQQHFRRCPLALQCYRTTPSHFWEQWHHPSHPREQVLRLSYSQTQVDRAVGRDVAMGIDKGDDGGGFGLSDEQLAKEINSLYVHNIDYGNDFDNDRIKRLQQLANTKANKHRKDRFDFLMSETNKYLKNMVKRLVKEKKVDKQQGKNNTIYFSDPLWKKIKN